MKNESPEFFRDGTVKKQSLYALPDFEHIMHQIKPGDTDEIRNAYVGQQKLPSRVVIYRLTSTQVHKRRKQQTYVEKKKGVTYAEKSKRLTEINVYITNIRQLQNNRFLVRFRNRLFILYLDAITY
ncbi:Protein of unknown function [Bacillus cereus]|nr:Protein of unknown function [Bacillus cereus]